jgi:hypothetical protein
MLPHHINSLESAGLTYRYSQFDDVLQSVSKLENCEIAAKMQSCLPRELRDRVYSYMWDIDYLKSTLRRMAASLQGMNYESCGTKPHVIMPAYVDLDMAREVMEAYYRCAPGIVDAFVTRTPQDIKALLFRDVFNLGLKSVEHIRKLTVYINGGYEDDVEPETLKERLAQLFQIIRKKDFELEITSPQLRVRLRQWDELFSILGPFCKDFEATGAKVYLSWAQVEPSHFTHQVSRSVDDIFRQSYPGSNWKPDVIEWLKKQDIPRGPDREYIVEDRKDYNPEDYLWY